MPHTRGWSICHSGLSCAIVHVNALLAFVSCLLCLQNTRSRVSSGGARRWRWRYKRGPWSMSWRLERRGREAAWRGGWWWGWGKMATMLLSAGLLGLPPLSIQEVKCLFFFSLLLFKIFFFLLYLSCWHKNFNAILSLFSDFSVTISVGVWFICKYLKLD